VSHSLCLATQIKQPMALTIAAQLGVLLLLGVRDGVREGSAIAIYKVPYANLSLSLSLSLSLYMYILFICFVLCDSLDKAL